MTPSQSIKQRPPFFKRMTRGTGSFFAGIPGALFGLLLLLRLAWSKSCLEVSYWFQLFLYTSRNFLRLEAVLSVAGAVLFFGYIINNDLAKNGELLIYYSYIYFSIVMVLLSMNVLPREKSGGTLEILWSQPLSRSAMIVVQLVTLSIWMLALNLIWLIFIESFTAYPEGKWILLLLVWTTTVAVGAMTLFVSTFCRHAIATGLVSLLILGLHFYWLQTLGPVQFYFIPDNLPQLITGPETAQQGFGGRFGGRGGFGGNNNSLFSIWWDVIFNRVTLIVTVGFILDFLFRRLRRTAQWFT